MPQAVTELFRCCGSQGCAPTARSRSTEGASRGRPPEDVGCARSRSPRLAPYQSSFRAHRFHSPYARCTRDVRGVDRIKCRRNRDRISFHVIGRRTFLRATSPRMKRMLRIFGRHKLALNGLETPTDLSERPSGRIAPRFIGALLDLTRTCGINREGTRGFKCKRASGEKVIYKCQPSGSAGFPSWCETACRSFSWSPACSFRNRPRVESLIIPAQKKANGVGNRTSPGSVQTSAIRFPTPSHCRALQLAF